MKGKDRAWHRSFVGPSFECLRAATIEGMGVTVLARALVEAPLRVLGPGSGLPALPSVEVVYAFGRRTPSRVVTELALFLADCLSNSIGTSRRPMARASCLGGAACADEPDAVRCVGRADATFAEQGYVKINGEIRQKIDGAAAAQGHIENAALARAQERGAS